MVLNKNLTLSILIIAILAGSCLKKKAPGIPAEVQQSLNKSGIHKPDLMKVLLAFDQPEDSLKLQAAYFLIKNLENNYTIQMSFSDSSGNEFDIDPLNFKDYKSIKKYCDSIEIASEKISYKTDTILLDIENVSSEYLITHINNSYNTWQKSTWDKQYDFSLFCDFILPYRVANEELGIHSDYFKEKYARIVQKNLSIDEIAILINNEINDEITYDDRLVLNPNVQLISTTRKSCTGNLRDINVYKVTALRSIGIAAALDYTPFFADSILGYYSTTVILPNYNKLVLNNSDNQFTPYTNGKVAKVYRRSHNNDPESLFSIKDKEKHTPPFLGDYNYLDVTNEYLKTADVTIDFSDTSQFVYLAIINENKWQPIDWSSARDDNKAHFKNMGTGINYRAVVIKEKEIIPVGNVFYLTDNSIKSR